MENPYSRNLKDKSDVELVDLFQRCQTFNQEAERAIRDEYEYRSKARENYKGWTSEELTSFILHRKAYSTAEDHPYDLVAVEAELNKRPKYKPITSTVPDSNVLHQSSIDTYRIQSAGSSLKYLVWGILLHGMFNLSVLALSYENPLKFFYPSNFYYMSGINLIFVVFEIVQLYQAGENLEKSVVK